MLLFFLNLTFQRCVPDHLFISLTFGTSVMTSRHVQRSTPSGCWVTLVHGGDVRHIFETALLCSVEVRHCHCAVPGRSWNLPPLSLCWSEARCVIWGLQLMDFFGAKLSQSFEFQEDSVICLLWFLFVCLFVCFPLGSYLPSPPTEKSLEYLLSSAFKM